MSESRILGSFPENQRAFIIRFIASALEEDIGFQDITTDSTVDPDYKSVADIVAKENGVIAGLEVAEAVFKLVDDTLNFSSRFKDGDVIKNGDIVAHIEGSASSILKAERTALNFLQILSGTATFVRNLVNSIKGKKTKLLDTRKTIPGMRYLQKYAVRVGGGMNHRMGLYDMILIKENHITASGGIENAVRRAKKMYPDAKIEVETTSVKDAIKAAELGVDWVMLDNMSDEDVVSAFEKIKGKVKVEVSGGVTPERLVKLAEIGVDYVSMGKLTYAFKSLDMSLLLREMGKW